ncbi:hypothetical protein Maq22A_1p35835 (plasmid) [Methylobacterium aquaticum]|uniref:Uncharacterized protein n=1 Tax=Methylobacterium aquaticum TaxID=270351 RepID=A0A0C6FQQ0_9HYPH|nr:hypothetical protein Maq22A_1p35435 [Methylobacterium aquaticum]BAQ49387.1 hypothetical protein Maq22A_1p35835 [Methylobacterium aquaticum]
MDVIVLTRALDKLGSKVAAHLGEDRRQVADRQSREHVAAVFRDKDQVRMEGIHDVSALTDFHVAAPETNL